MKITFNEAVEDIKAYITRKDIEKDLIIETTSDLKIPSALESVQMLEDAKNLQRKVVFIYNMLKENGVSIKCKDKELCSFQVTEGMTFENVETFRRYPAIFRFFIDAIFGVFLKNSYPLLSESQEAD